MSRSTVSTDAAVAFLAFALALCLSRVTYCHAADVTHAKSHLTRAELIEMFARAVHFNDHFKSDVGRVSPGQLNKERHELELYDEDVVDEHLDDCVKLLSSGDDRTLAVAFFEFLVSAENSADE